MAVGLDFVKKVDSDWKKHIKYEDGSDYITEHCPVMNRRCVKEDCVFWKEGGCIYNERQKSS